MASIVHAIERGASGSMRWLHAQVSCGGGAVRVTRQDPKALRHGLGGRVTPYGRLTAQTREEVVREPSREPPLIGEIDIIEGPTCPLRHDLIMPKWSRAMIHEWRRQADAIRSR